jgi:DUF971 family protein
MGKHPRPTNILLHKQSRVLAVDFDDGSHFDLSCEYLRVFSPSAEVRGHGPGQEVLQHGKENVGIDQIEPQGSYAVRLYFDDGHNTGIYSWETLYELGQNYDEFWQAYLNRLSQAGRHRRPTNSGITVTVTPPTPKILGT